MQVNTYFTDEVYLDSSRHLDRLKKANPLKIHESLFKLIDKYVSNSSSRYTSILDVGCGFGEFLMHIQRQPYSLNLKLSGLEKSNKLADFSRSHLQDVQIYSQDFAQFCKLSTQPYDIICISGVHPTVDDLSEFLSPLKSIVHESSLILINGPFHTRDLSLFVQWSFDNEPSVSNKGWNVYSVGSVVKLMKSLGYNLSCNDVINVPSINEDLDSLAQFNITSTSGSTYYLNGLGLRFSINTLAFQLTH